MTVTRREAVARAIYMTHWELPEESKRGPETRWPPTWETASPAVRDWVLAQADSAIEAMEQIRAAEQQSAPQVSLQGALHTDRRTG
jgi:hypothetical protein